MIQPAVGQEWKVARSFTSLLHPWASFTHGCVLRLYGYYWDTDEYQVRCKPPGAKDYLGKGLLTLLEIQKNCVCMSMGNASAAGSMASAASSMGGWGSTAVKTAEEEIDEVELSPWATGMNIPRPKCECGALKTYGENAHDPSFHSSWCPASKT